MNEHLVIGFIGNTVTIVCQNCGTPNVFYESTIEMFINDFRKAMEE